MPKHPKKPAEKKPPLTHFLCLPLLTPSSIPQFKASLAHLKASVPSKPAKEVNTPGGNGADEGAQEKALEPLFSPKALRPLGALHLTLGVMSLGDEEKLEAAKAFLGTLDPASDLRKASPGGEEDGKSTAASPTSPPTSEARESQQAPLSPLVISLEGLFEFHRPQKATRLLAEPVDPTGRLLPFARAVRQRSMDAGILVPEERELKLHATLVNTVYVRGGRGKGGGGKRRIEFDGRELIKMFEERGGGVVVQDSGEEVVGRYVWARDVVLDRLQICEMGAQKVEDEDMGQEYRVVAEKRILDGQ
ncbi:MAG: hypothetical protein Q9227_006438 [Pyrenula ochraceoflavens]